VVLVPIVLLLVWREKPHWLAILAVLFAALGAFLLSTAGESLRLHLGDVLELIGALGWTMHVILLGKVAARYEPLGFSVGQLVICSLLNIGAASVIEKPSLAQLGPLALPILYTALLSVGLGYTLQVWAQRHTPPADAALILSLESVFAALAGWVVLREFLAPVQIVGCVMIFAAVIFSQAKPRVSV
jgi:drug/metabolite transporter (DMT)-like permease